MNYVDGFVVPVPAGKKEEYRKMSAEASVVFRDYGAIRHVECWGDDVPEGKVTDFKRSVQATGDEVVVFSWIEWPSKAARDDGMKKAMEDPRFKNMSPDKMPFDGKRMIFGGFATIMDTAAK